MHLKSDFFPFKVTLGTLQGAVGKDSAVRQQCGNKCSQIIKFSKIIYANRDKGVTILELGLEGEIS